MKLAVQMYTLRDFTKTPEALDETLGKVAEMGYGAVQLSAIGAWDAGLIDAAGLRALLDKYGLVCCATHRPLANYLEQTAGEVEIHRTLGCDYTAIGSIAGQYGFAPEGYRKFIADMAPAIAAMKAGGLRFGFHNHALEFMHQPGTRKPCFDILVEEGGDDLFFEIDTYWVAVAAYDPAVMLKQLAGKIPVIHVKDLEVIGWEAPTYAPVGEGNLDWDAILAEAKQGGTEWLVVEQDTCRRDPFDCLQSSFQFLSPLVS